MGELWENLKEDPVIGELRKVIETGAEGLRAADLPLLAHAFGASNSPAGEAERRIRDGLRQLILAESENPDVALEAQDKSTQMSLVLWGLDGDSRYDRARLRREAVGALYKPASPISPDAVRKTPSEKQITGGIEWGLAQALRDRLKKRGRLSPRDSTARRDVRKDYIPVEDGDLEEGFFDRASTREYIEALASLEALTLVLGNEATPEMQEPLYDRVIPHVLAELIEADNPEFDDVAARAMVERLSKRYGPAFLGSVTRELMHAEQHNEYKVAGAISRELTRGRSSASLLIRSAGTLAFAFRHSDRDVRMLTTSFDTRLAEKEEYISTYFQEFRRYSFLAVTGPEASSSGDVGVPVYYLNGAVGEGTPSLIVGEADAFAQYDGSLKPDDAMANWRERVTRESLQTCPALFVASNLTDPDLLASLARTKYATSKYALMLAVDEASAENGRESTSEMADTLSDQRLIRNLVSQRYLHLGVVPIIADFHHQMPQFLREVALRVYLGKSGYRPYPERVRDWWNEWATRFGYSGDRSTGRRDEQLQRQWMERLAALRDRIGKMLHPRGRDGGEVIQVEVWIRNPIARTLFLWANSEGIWLNGRTAHRFQIADRSSRFVQQRVFTTGITHAGAISPRGVMRFQVSMPLVLQRSPWYHLPVGVVTVMSSRDERDQGARLAAVTKDRVRFDELDHTLREELHHLLDPVSGDAGLR